jgi:hypothetical protein
MVQASYSHLNRREATISQVGVDEEKFFTVVLRDITKRRRGYFDSASNTASTFTWPLESIRIPINGLIT